MNRGDNVSDAATGQLYDMLAARFYDPILHPTTDLFGRVAESYLRSQPLFSRPGNYLEVGIGRSRLAPLVPPPARLVGCDISIGMLKYSQPLEGRLLLVLATAAVLPFQRRSMAGVLAILGDPFATSDFFIEAFRVTRGNGYLLYIGPTSVWGRPLREFLGVRPDMTPMVTSAGETLLVPSFLLSSEDLRTVAMNAGFSNTDTIELCIPKDLPEDQIPKHIRLAAECQSTDPYSLPILAVLRAWKAP